MPRKYRRTATVDELKALAHPIRIRVLRECFRRPRTNQELADQFGIAPGTMLRHVKTLTATGLLVEEPSRPGPRGVVERPYRATGLTWHINLAGTEPDLALRVEVAALDAYREELVAAGPGATRSRGRIAVRMPAAAHREFTDRLEALVDEYSRREAPSGELVNIIWSVHVQTDAEPDGTRPAPG